MEKEQIDDLLHIQHTISNMNKTNHIQILQILVNCKIEMNENKYGVHVNLSNCNNDTINKLKDYIKTTMKQDELLNNIEYRKKDVKDKYFTSQIL